jgi:hypothetical protein
MAYLPVCSWKRHEGFGRSETCRLQPTRPRALTRLKWHRFADEGAGSGEPTEAAADDHYRRVGHRDPSP